MSTIYVTWLLVAVVGLLVLFYLAATRPRFTAAFFIALMTVSAILAVAGVAMLVDGDTTWKGIALMCFGLTHLLATMVACVVLCRPQNRTDGDRRRERRQKPVG